MKNTDKTKEQLLKEIDQLTAKIAELKKNKEIFQIIAENTSDNIGITTFDLKAKYIYVSPSVKSVLGYDPEDLIGKSFFDFIHPEDKKALFPLLKKYINFKVNKLLTGKESTISEIIEFRFKNKAGNWRFMQSTVNIAGKQLLAVTRDLTDRKKAEEALKESENNLRTLFNAMTDIVFEMDYDGRYINIAPTSPELLFKPPEEVIGKSLYEVFPKPEADTFLEFIHKCMDENKTTSIEYSLIINDKTVWFEGRATPKTQNSVLFIARDITERKQAEEALRESEEKYRSLYTSANDAIFLMQNNKFIACNPKTLEMFGCMEDEIVGHSPIEFSPDYQPDGELSSEKALEKINATLAEEPQVFEWVHQQKDGSPFEAEVSLNKMMLSDGECIHAIVRDITKRKQAEEELRKYHEQLEELVKERTLKLEEQNKELERLNHLFVNREFRIKELRDRVKELENKISDI